MKGVNFIYSGAERSVLMGLVEDVEKVHSLFAYAEYDAILSIVKQHHDAGTFKQFSEAMWARKNINSRLIQFISRRYPLMNVMWEMWDECKINANENANENGGS